jgi:hypothetical protein
VSVQEKSETVVKIKDRDERGRAIRTMEQMTLDHEAATMRIKGAQFKEIAEHFGVVVSAAYNMVVRAWADLPMEETAELVAREIAKLDLLEANYYEIMEKHHVLVAASGKVAYNESTGEPIEDDGPTMQAMAGLLKVADRRAKLLGLNPPTKTELTGVVVTANIESQSEKAKEAVLGLLARMSETSAE